MYAESERRTSDKAWRSAVTLAPSDLLPVDIHALGGTQDGDQTRTFAARWMGPLAVPSRVKALAYTLELPPEWRCHKTIGAGFPKRFRDSATFRQTLPRRAATRGPAARAQDVLEVLETNA